MEDLTQDEINALPGNDENPELREFLRDADDTDVSDLAQDVVVELGDPGPDTPNPTSEDMERINRKLGTMRAAIEVTTHNSIIKKFVEDMNKIGWIAVGMAPSEESGYSVIIFGSHHARYAAHVAAVARNLNLATHEEVFADILILDTDTVLGRSERADAIAIKLQDYITENDDCEITVSTTNDSVIYTVITRTEVEDTDDDDETLTDEEMDDLEEDEDEDSDED